MSAVDDAAALAFTHLVSTVRRYLAGKATRAQLTFALRWYDEVRHPRKPGAPEAA